jgi:hypothetical protein
MFSQAEQPKTQDASEIFLTESQCSLLPNSIPSNFQPELQGLVSQYSRTASANRFESEITALQSVRSEFKKLLACGYSGENFIVFTLSKTRSL